MYCMYVCTYVSTYVNTWAYTYHAQKVGFGLVRWLLSGSLNPNHLVPKHTCTAHTVEKRKKGVS